MSIFDIFGRCSCNGSSAPSSSNKCICLSTYHQDCDLGVMPCGGSINVDLYAEELVYDTPCAAGVTFQITAYDDEFSNVAISSEGVITGDLNGEPDKQYEIYYKMKCPSLGTAVNGRAIFCVRNLCKGVLCAETQTCNECTGNCENTQADLEVG